MLASLTEEPKQVPGTEPRKPPQGGLLFISSFPLLRPLLARRLPASWLSKTMLPLTDASQRSRREPRYSTRPNHQRGSTRPADRHRVVRNDIPTGRQLSSWRLVQLAEHLSSLAKPTAGGSH